MSTQSGVFVETNVEQINYFASKSEFIDFLLLKYLMSTKDPVGSWVLKVMLELRNVEVSIATVGRILKTLDAKGYTKLVQTQGRVITPKGAAYLRNLQEKVEREALQQKLLSACQPQDLEELLDLLHARTALECETASLAARRATSKQKEALELSMKKHEQCVLNKHDPTACAFDFHLKIAEASQNRFLIASLNILIYEELQLESKFEALITRERGEEYAEEHSFIVEAIINGNAQEAEKQMKKHMQTILKAIEEQAQLWRENIGRE